MMGEANMLYASQQFAEAVTLLLEVVRQAPNVVDPYHTLGLIYEEMGDLQKSLEFFMIAAHLTPKDGSLWKRLGLMSRDFGKPRQAIYCFTKGISFLLST
jgi:general transcription factor 3C polypeptide 3 (transcription factor C subunit 4)